MAMTSSMSSWRLDGQLDAVGDEALDAHRAVVGAQDQLVTHAGELLLPEHEALGAEAQHADDLGAALLISAGQGVHRRHAQPAAHADHGAGVTQRARVAQGADQGVELEADLAHLLHEARGLANGLDDHGDGAPLAVEVGDGQGNPLALRVDHHQHELARLGGLGHERVAHLDHVGDVGVVLPRDDLDPRNGLRFHGAAPSHALPSQSLAAAKPPPHHDPRHGDGRRMARG